LIFFSEIHDFRDWTRLTTYTYHVYTNKAHTDSDKSCWQQ